jgi:hypothetical protein
MSDAKHAGLTADPRVRLQPLHLDNVRKGSETLQQIKCLVAFVLQKG